MPGIQDFTYANYGKETTRGTPVAPTRKGYFAATGVLDHDLSKSFHEGENRGLKVPRVRSTTQAEDVNLKIETTDGITYDGLVLPLTQLRGGLTGVGAGADKTWTCVPSLTAANNQEAFSWDVGDDVQNWRVQYAMLRSFKLSAALGELTQLSGELFGQRAVKTAKATPGDTSSPTIPGDLWTVRFATSLAGLAGASAVANFLLSWELDVTTGLVWRHYMDGNAYGAQHVEVTYDATLTMEVESTAQAITQFYDKYVADTLDFVRLRAVGPALGGSNYSAQVDVPVLYDKPSIIDSEDEGVNVYKIVGKLSADSPTAPTQGLGLVVVNSLAAIP